MDDSAKTRISAGEIVARLTVCNLGAALLYFLVMPTSALAAGPGASTSGRTSTEVKIETVAGSNIKRITLTEKAVKRIGIATTMVDEGRIIRTQVIGGMFLPGAAIPPPQQPRNMVGRKLGMFSFQASAPAQSSKPASTPGRSLTANGAIRVAFSAREWERWSKDKSARVFRLAPRQSQKKSGGLIATSLKTPPIQDFKRSMLVQYFVLKDTGHGLKPNERVRVELELKGSDTKMKFVPYSAVHYDPNGGEWIYAVTKPRTFERRQIKIAYIVNGKAVLRDGPPVGTKIVRVGVAMLHGVEVYGK